MKLYTGFAAMLFLAIAISACKKSDDDKPATIDNTWKLGTTTYTVNNYAKANETFQAYDKAGNGVHFSFKTFPAADGNYNVVGRTATLGANDVSILAFGSNMGSSYFSTGNDRIVASVKIISGSRLRISLPDTWMAGGSDSLKLSATLGDL